MTPTKTPYHLLDWSFLSDMAEVMREGKNKPGRKQNGWTEIPASDEMLNEYFSASLRHLIEGVNQENPLALASVACNAMILYNMVLRRAQNEPE